jgi:hypothetical protein
MDYFFRLVRIPYEEPHHLNLLLEVSNGRQTGALEFYIATDALREAGKALELFPRHASDVYLFELGSERPEDRFGFYLHIRAALTNGRGDSAFQFRMNNNEAFPCQEISEFCIASEIQHINRLGSLIRAFSKLEHKSLYWSAAEATLA